MDCWDTMAPPLTCTLLKVPPACPLAKRPGLMQQHPCMSQKGEHIKSMFRKRCCHLEIIIITLVHQIYRTLELLTKICQIQSTEATFKVIFILSIKLILTQFIRKKKALNFAIYIFSQLRFKKCKFVYYGGYNNVNTLVNCLRSDGNTRTWGVQGMRA